MRANAFKQSRSTSEKSAIGSGAYKSPSQNEEVLKAQKTRFVISRSVVRFLVPAPNFKEGLHSGALFLMERNHYDLQVI
jgi:hypothetical protein